MKIQVWSDFRCPFCYLGKVYLDDAIAKSSKDIEVEMMSFELDPNYQPVSGSTYIERLSKNTGMSEMKAQLNINRILQMTKEAGLNYDFDSLKEANSFKLHKVFQLAKEKGVGNEFFDLGYQAHFEKGLDIADDQVIIDLGSQLGLDSKEILEAISSDEYGYKVRQDQGHAQQIGVQGVPHFVFDDKVFVNGAQPPEAFLEAFEYVESLNQESDLMCTDESCTS